MTDTTNPAPEAPQANEVAPETTETPAPVSEGKGLRTQLEAALKENRELKAEKRDGIIEGLGLDTSTGLGLVLAEQFDDGTIGLDDIVATATTKYGHTVPEAVDQHPQTQTIQQEQARLDRVGEQAGAVPIPDEANELATAEAEGDYQKTLAMKGKTVESWFRGAPGQR